MLAATVLGALALGLMIVSWSDRSRDKRQREQLAARLRQDAQ